MAPPKHPTGASQGNSDVSPIGDRIVVVPGETHLGGGTHDSNLVGHMARLRESPLHFFRDLSLHVQGTGWRSYDDIVGQRIFCSGFTEDIKRAVMTNTMLRDKMKALAIARVREERSQGLHRDTKAALTVNDRLEQLESQLQERAEMLLNDLICKMESKNFIRSAYYLVTALLTRAYHQGIHVSSQEVTELRSVAEYAAAKNQSIIFLPSHRSHVDYVALQLVCYRLGLALPTVVAGDNLNFPLLGSFLQHAGAMWIRRSFGDDSMYVTLVQAYIDTLLTKGHNFECFIEGGRSRIGKLLPPKFGILSFLLDSLLSGRVEDAFICPVSTQYDKVIEVDSYISELLGRPKRKENLKDFLSASSILSLKLGRIDVRFQRPWSLRDFIETQKRRNDSLWLSKNEELHKASQAAARTRLLRTLGYQVLVDINAVSVIMPTSLIGTVLLTLRGRGVGRSELVRRVDWLSDRIRSQGGRVAHFAGQPTSVVVERGLDVLGPSLVGVSNDLVESTFFAADRFQLSFYRNMTIHLFITHALVSVSLYTCIKSDGRPESQAMPYKELLAQVSFLSQLFRGEFIFPTEGLEVNLLHTLKGLENEGVIRATRSTQTGSLDSSISHIELSESERAEGRNNFDFYCFLIWPFVDASWLGALSLMMLVPPNEARGQLLGISTREFQDSAQLLGKTLYAQGDLSYLEAVNKETLKNSFARFEEDGLINTKVYPKEVGFGQGMVRLNPEWTPKRDEDGSLCRRGRLWELCKVISRFRIEGKHRRDGDAAVERVLRLVDDASGKLWENWATRARSEMSKASGQYPTEISEDSAEMLNSGRQRSSSPNKARL